MKESERPVDIDETLSLATEVLRTFSGSREFSIFADASSRRGSFCKVEGKHVSANISQNEASLCSSLVTSSRRAGARIFPLCEYFILIIDELHALGREELALAVFSHAVRIFHTTTIDRDGLLSPLGQSNRDRTSFFCNRSDLFFAFLAGHEVGHALQTFEDVPVKIRNLCVVNYHGARGFEQPHCPYLQGAGRFHLPEVYLKYDLKMRKPDGFICRYENDIPAYKFSSNDSDISRPGFNAHLAEVVSDFFGVIVAARHGLKRSLPPELLVDELLSLVFHLERIAFTRQLIGKLSKSADSGIERINVFFPPTTCYVRSRLMVFTIGALACGYFREFSDVGRYLASMGEDKFDELVSFAESKELEMEICRSTLKYAALATGLGLCDLVQQRKTSENYSVQENFVYAFETLPYKEFRLTTGLERTEQNIKNDGDIAFGISLREATFAIRENLMTSKPMNDRLEHDLSTLANELRETAKASSISSFPIMFFHSSE